MFMNSIIVDQSIAAAMIVALEEAKIALSDNDSPLEQL